MSSSLEKSSLELVKTMQNCICCLERLNYFSYIIIPYTEVESGVLEEIPAYELADPACPTLHATLSSSSSYNSMHNGKLATVIMDDAPLSPASAPCSGCSSSNCNTNMDNLSRINTILTPTVSIRPETYEYHGVHQYISWAIIVRSISNKECGGADDIKELTKW